MMGDALEMARWVFFFCLVFGWLRGLVFFFADNIILRASINLRTPSDAMFSSS